MSDIRYYKRPEYRNKKLWAASVEEAQSIKKLSWAKPQHVVSGTTKRTDWLRAA
ncbi:hypothetical protein [Hymenobacter swuensis]|uniref:Uncharacterized protein n=1 Tax=Hymenobacter swuensis DY53 TaxID=1227739 RepID=W8F5Y9_9BACT|nr:hypothetical protein [Hymenobacter swuensis]AHJ97175.1 hypothetical protein Hsw_1580 [Hymenobacter swuensis DY53]